MTGKKQRHCELAKQSDNRMERIENQSEFEQLFRQYYPKLCSIARGYVRERMLVEEIVSDVFIKFWTNRSRIIIHSSLQDYLFKSTQNACIDYLRTRPKQRSQTSYLEEELIVCATLADLGENPLDYIINNETEERLWQAIEELPERYRMTFKLRRIDELSYDEIAVKMSITKNTVKSNLRDAMAILREKLKDLILLVLLLAIIFCF